MKILECLKQHWWFPIEANTWPTLFLHHPPPPPKKKTFAMVLCSEGIVFGFFLGGREGGRAVMPFHTLSFCFQIIVIKPAFITCYSAVKKVITFNSIPFHSCKVTFFILWNLCFSLSKQGTQRAQTFWYSKLCTFCWSAFQSLLPFPWLWFCLMSPIDLSLVSVQTVCMYKHGADQQYLCQSLKCFTRHLTLVAPMQAFLYV